MAGRLYDCDISIAADWEITAYKPASNSSMTLEAQLVWLFVLSIPIACISWTVTHEDIFREFRRYCQGQIDTAPRLWQRRFFYLFTCEYCFSHYVAAAFLVLTGFRLLCLDWRGYVIAFFSLPWIANAYMGVFGRVKLGVQRDRTQIKAIEQEVKNREAAEYPRLERPVA